MVEAIGFRSDALEAMNAEDGLMFLVEGDAQGIVKMLKEEESSLDILIRDTVSLAQHLSFCSFHFVSCNFNRAAHITAKYVLSLDHYILEWRFFNLVTT